MTPFRPIFAVLDAIRTESSPIQISLAVMLAAFMATSPIPSPQAIAALVLLCVVRVNILAFVIAYGIFASICMPMEGFFHRLGHWILVDTPRWRRLCAGLYHSPVFPFTQFNNTVVLGGFAFFLFAALPLFLGTYLGYKKLQPHVWLRIQQTNAFMALRATLLFRRYAEYVTKKKS